MAYLNNLDASSGDIHHVFLEAPTKEKIFFFAGDEWNTEQEILVIVVRALYGLKYSALQFRNFLSEILGNRFGWK